MEITTAATFLTTITTGFLNQHHHHHHLHINKIPNFHPKISLNSTKIPSSSYFTTPISTSLRNFGYFCSPIHPRIVASSSISGGHDETPSQELAILLEIEGKTGGDEEKMLVLFFDRIGWPTSLATNEKESFMKSVMKEKLNALDEFVMTKGLPLRPGVEKSVTVKLGPERVSKIKIVGKEEMEESFYGQLVLGKGASSGLHCQLAKEARKAASAQKQRIAEEVASFLKVSVEIDTSPTERSEKIVATLRAGVEYAGVPVHNSVLIAGGQSGVVGAERIGMSCVVLRSSLTSRAEFPSVKATMDGFGGADLTISKLRQKRWT